MGGTGGILVASHLVGREMRRIIDEPEQPARDRGRAARPLRGAVRHDQPDPRQGRAEHGRAARSAGCGCRSWRRRRRRRAVIRDGARAPRPARRGLSRDTLRVLPLGGLGEIGKNMMVVEYGGRIVVVDTGPDVPRRPTSSASTSCCPTSPTCASGPTTSRRSCSRTGTRTTWGRCRSCCASWTRVAAHLRRPAHRRDGALEARRAQAARTSPVEDVLAGADLRGRAVLGRDGEDGPLDPGHVRRGAHLRARHDADDRRLQVRPDAGGRRARGRRAAGRAGPRGAAAAVRRLDQRRPPGRVAVRVERRAAPRGGVRPLPGAHRGHLLRLEHPPRAAGGGRRRRAVGRQASRWSAARCART